ncbi:MAG: MGH1-like glycoside hydrolase domain-containing protein [Mycobacterium leprae]
MGAERERVLGFDSKAPDLASVTPWYLWGPYVSERAWGTVRENYGPDNGEWHYFPHGAARSRAYRWNEDGMAAVCDVQQRLCLGLALWNGRDCILKERMFGLGNPEGNHGEDVKEYYWYVDAVPTHSWLRWRYHYPQREFPYAWLRNENRRRRTSSERGGFEFELLDTGIFDENRYWVVDVTYAKAGPTDVLMRVDVRNAGPDEATLHVLPTLWFRNTWSWEPDVPRPLARAVDGDIVAEHGDLGDYRLHVGASPTGARPSLLFCDNDTNVARLFPPAPNTTEFPKDGINDHVVARQPTVNLNGTGTKAAAWYVVSVPANGTAELRLRLRAEDGGPVRDPLGDVFTQTMRVRKAEADEFYDELAPPGTCDDRKLVMRQAYAGMIWCKQFYHYEVSRWLRGDAPAQPDPAFRARNRDWPHFAAADVLSMPDTWEFPWFAAWDLAFHAVVLAHVDPPFAKHQLELLCSPRYQHPDGALPGGEWRFDDANPPVHAWAALKVWRLDGCRDEAFLTRVFGKLLANFTWWVNREDSDGNNLFQGGFLGLDNISIIDRSDPGGTLEQADATGWMGFYCLSMLEIARWLAWSDDAVTPLVAVFADHFANLTKAINDRGLWDPGDQFYYDLLRRPNEPATFLRVRSLVGLVPVLATSLFPPDQAESLDVFEGEFAGQLPRRQLDAPAAGDSSDETGAVTRFPDGRVLFSMLDERQLAALLNRYLLDEKEFLSKHGIRSLSARYREPYVADSLGSIQYRPAESVDGLLGGNSNWRGPIWAPLNYLLIDAIAEFGEAYGDSLRVSHPDLGTSTALLDVAHDLRQRVVALFLRDGAGRRPCYGGVRELQEQWSDTVLFNEYFHGDNGAGLGASHQTGWTGLVADLICGLRGVARPTDQP